MVLTGRPCTQRTWLGTLAGMSRILIVTDEPWARNEVHAALSLNDNVLIDHIDTATAADTAADESVDAAIVDLQVGAMGGMAITRSIRALGDAAPPVVLLLDRSADTFLAGRAGAAAWVVKPFAAYELRDALAAAIGAGA